MRDYRREGWAWRTESSWQNHSLTPQLSFETHGQGVKQRDVRTALPGKMEDHLMLRKKHVKADFILIICAAKYIKY